MDARRAKAVVLSRAPDEALVVDVAGGLNSGDVVKQADGVLVKTAYRIIPRVGTRPTESSLPTLTKTLSPVCQSLYDKLKLIIGIQSKVRTILQKTHKLRAC